MDLGPGVFVGDHELLERVGAGGFSIVWKARHPESGRVVALKVPRVEALLDHLRREAELGARIQDPQVAGVLAVRLDAEPPHLVMPWIEGRHIAVPEAVPAPRGILDGIELALDLARVLGRLHARGIAHGDVKPGNVLVGPDGRVRLLDLGLARLQVRTRLDRSLAESLASVDGRSIAGTLDYMPPETFEGREPGPSADVYALGVLLHHLLTGRPPAFGVSPSAVNPFLTPAIEDLLRRMLHHEPERRAAAPQVVAELEALAAAERRCLARRNGHARRRVFIERMATVQRGLRALAVSTALLVAIAGAAFLALRLAESTRASEPLAVLLGVGLAFGGVFLTFVPFLLAVTTINAWLLGIPEKTYKNRAGHPFWSFMMQ